MKSNKKLIKQYLKSVFNFIQWNNTQLSKRESIFAAILWIPGIYKKIAVNLYDSMSGNIDFIYKNTRYFVEFKNEKIISIKKI